MSSPDSHPEKTDFRYRFGPFELDVADRQLWQGSKRLDLNARYLDALMLMVKDHSRLIDKERFFDEVWDDVVVSDSALSQCIKELRRTLDDDASDPRYIQTVPRQGYRFVADVSVVSVDAPLAHNRKSDLFRALQLWGTGSAGGALAGLIGGLLYGFSLSTPEAGIGTLSTLLVLVGLNVVVGLTGAAGISAGLAGAWWLSKKSPERHWSLSLIGAIMGGLVVGSAAKMLGMDAFNLLLGRAPAGITGGLEGAGLGAAVALGALLGSKLDAVPKDWRDVAGGGLAGTAIGIVIPISGGHLMGGSLKLLAESFQESQLRLDTFASLFGGIPFGPLTEAALAGLEGLIFGACVAGAFAWARRTLVT